jgi:hypothetical protein
MGDTVMMELVNKIRELVGEHGWKVHGYTYENYGEGDRFDVYMKRAEPEVEPEDG